MALVLLSVLLPIAGRVSNCGGNSAALSNCGSYAQGAFVSAHDRPDRIFNVEGSSMRDYLLGIAADTGWIGNAEYLVRTGNILIGEGHKEILIVCSRPFTNVPQRFWRSNAPTHAAGLADGSAVLLSVDEFESLDLETFVSGSRLNEVHSQPEVGNVENVSGEDSATVCEGIK